MCSVDERRISISGGFLLLPLDTSFQGRPPVAELNFHDVTMPRPFPAQSTEDTRIGDVRPLLPPACLCEELPLTLAARQTVIAARQAVQAVLDDTDDRLVVIVGPCSIHDVKAAKEYGAVGAHLLIFHCVTNARPRDAVCQKKTVRCSVFSAFLHCVGSSGALHSLRWIVSWRSLE